MKKIADNRRDEMLQRFRKMVALLLCVVLALALASCGASADSTTGGVDYSKQAKEDSENLQDVALGSTTTFKVPAAWTRSSDSTDSDATYYAPWGKGVISLAVATGNTFPDDTETFVKETLLADTDTMTFENVVIGNKGFAETYTADITRTTDDEKYQGKMFIILSGATSYIYGVILPQSAYAAYESLIPELFSSIDGMALTLAPNKKTSTATASNGAATTNASTSADSGTTESAATEDTQATKTYGEGTYKVGTDMPAGEYKVTCTGDRKGYWKVTESSEVGARILSNDSFNGASYVTLSDGQYIKFERCQAVAVE